MSIVVDPSFAASWFLPDEGNAAGEAVLDHVAHASGRVPALFWHELRNLLLMAERRGRIPPQEGDQIMLRARALNVVEGPTDDRATLELARRHRLSAYDAAYLALALSERVPIATADAALARAARRENVEVQGTQGTA